MKLKREKMNDGEVSLFDTFLSEDGLVQVKVFLDMGSLPPLLGLGEQCRTSQVIT